MKLQNNSGMELSFPSIGFKAPVGDFEVPKGKLSDALLKNDAITLKGNITKIVEIDEDEDEVKTKIIQLKEKKQNGR